MCFPSGIKICYIENESELKPNNTFTTTLSNEAGEQHYLTVTHFYQRFDFLDFEQYFLFNPIKDYFKMTKTIELIENTKTDSQRKTMENKLKKNLEICTKFINNTYVYIPHAICLISKFPYAYQMEQTLESLFKIFSDKNSNQKEINNFLVHIINEIPIPPPNKKLYFYLPYSLNQIELFSDVYRNFPYNSFNINKTLDYFSSENFVAILFLILFEQKILFICDSYNTLSEVLLSFITLIYPFEYVNILIPILSEELVKYLQCFRPFIMGIDESMLETAKSYIEEDQAVFFVHIKKDLVEIFYKKKLKKATKKAIFCDNTDINLDYMDNANNKETPKSNKENINYILPSLPEEMYNDFKKDIDKLSSLNIKNKKNKKNKVEEIERIKFKIKKTCIKLFAFIFGDYSKYLTYIDKIPIFNGKSFIASKPKSFNKFYDEITSTHIFKYFLQISTNENFVYFEKLCIRYSNRGRIGSINNVNTINKDKHNSKSKKSNFFLNNKDELNNHGNKIDYSRSSSQNVKYNKRDNTKERDNKYYNITNSNNGYLNNSNVNKDYYNYNKNVSTFRDTNLLSLNENIKLNLAVESSNRGGSINYINLKSADILVAKSNINNDSSIRGYSDSNSLSNSKSENTETNRISAESDNYMILPYFIHSLLNSEVSKIEFFINEKNKSIYFDMKFFN